MASESAQEKKPAYVVEAVHSAQLTEVQRKALINFGISAFGPTMPPPEVDEHLVGTVRFVVDPANEIGAFGTSEVVPPSRVFNNPSLPQENGMYIGAIAVHDDAKGRGMASAIIGSQLQELVASHLPNLTTRTQNHVVERTVTSRFDALVKNQLIKTYTVERILFPGLYGRRLAHKLSAPPPGSPYEKLDFDAGDAYGLVYTITY